MAKKTTTPTDKATKKSPVTRTQFRKGAKPLMVSVNGIQTVANAKEFSTGTLGWFANGSTVVEVDGVPCKVTFQVQMYVANSKEATE